MEGDVGETVPDDLRAWVDARAEAEGVDPATVLRRALSTYRLAVTDSGASLDDVQSMSERLGTVEERIADLDEDVDEKISDVRMRVVQVKRETDEKAPRDHAHPDLQTRLGATATELDAVRDRVADVDDRVDAGFDNFEEILSYLDETTADLDEHLRVVAQSLLDLRRRASDLEAAHLERQALSDLLRVANDTGEHKATCEECGQTVHLDLLTEPRCPGCRSPFDELSPSSGFFGSATLHTGRPPALEAASEEATEETPLDVAATADSRPDRDAVGLREDEQTHEAATSGDRER